MPKTLSNGRSNTFERDGRVIALEQQLASNVSFGNVTVQSLVVNGNLVVYGSTLNIDTLQTLIHDNVILLNDAQTAPGVALGIAGFEIDRGTTQHPQMIWNESSGTFRIGLQDNTQRLATLQDSSANQQLVVWNGDKLVNSTQISLDLLNVTSASVDTLYTNTLTIHDSLILNASITNMIATTNTDSNEINTNVTITNALLQNAEITNLSSTSTLLTHAQIQNMVSPSTTLANSTIQNVTIPSLIANNVTINNFFLNNTTFANVTVTDNHTTHSFIANTAQVTTLNTVNTTIQNLVVTNLTNTFFSVVNTTIQTLNLINASGTNLVTNSLSANNMISTLSTVQHASLTTLGSNNLSISNAILSNASISSLLLNTQSLGSAVIPNATVQSALYTQSNFTNVTSVSVVGLNTTLQSLLTTSANANVYATWGTIDAGQSNSATLHNTLLSNLTTNDVVGVSSIFTNVVANSMRNTHLISTQTSTSSLETLNTSISTLTTTQFDTVDSTISTLITTQLSTNSLITQQTTLGNVIAACSLGNANSLSSTFNTVSSANAYLVNLSSNTISATNTYISNLSSTHLAIGNATINTFIVNNTSVGSLTISNLSVLDLSTSSLLGTNLILTNASFGDSFLQNATGTNLISTHWSGNSLNATSLSSNSVTIGSTFTTNLSVSNFLSGGTLTNVVVTNLSNFNLFLINASFTNLGVNNASSTNLVVTNLSFTNMNTTNQTIGNIQLSRLSSASNILGNVSSQSLSMQSVSGGDLIFNNSGTTLQTSNVIASVTSFNTLSTFQGSHGSFLTSISTGVYTILPLDSPFTNATLITSTSGSLVTVTTNVLSSTSATILGPLCYGVAADLNISGSVTCRVGVAQTAPVNLVSGYGTSGPFNVLQTILTNRTAGLYTTTFTFGHTLTSGSYIAFALRSATGVVVNNVNSITFSNLSMVGSNILQNSFFLPTISITSPTLRSSSFNLTGANPIVNTTTSTAIYWPSVIKYSGFTVGTNFISGNNATDGTILISVYMTYATNGTIVPFATLGSFNITSASQNFFVSGSTFQNAQLSLTPMFVSLAAGNTGATSASVYQATMSSIQLSIPSNVVGLGISYFAETAGTLSMNLCNALTTSTSNFKLISASIILSRLGSVSIPGDLPSGDVIITNNNRIAMGPSTGSAYITSTLGNLSLSNVEFKNGFSTGAHLFTNVMSGSVSDVVGNATVPSNCGHIVRWKMTGTNQVLRFDGLNEAGGMRTLLIQNSSGSSVVGTVASTMSLFSSSGASYGLGYGFTISTGSACLSYRLRRVTGTTHAILNASWTS